MRGPAGQGWLTPCLSPNRRSDATREGLCASVPCPGPALPSAAMEYVVRTAVEGEVASVVDPASPLSLLAGPQPPPHISAGMSWPLFSAAERC